MKRRSLLQTLAERYPRTDREELYALVMGGRVRVAGHTVRDPATIVAPTAAIAFTAARYVSRAGDKLAAALAAWQPRVAGRVWLDAGASSGGFTDCLLRHGARLVHAVDVGHNQLDYRLRGDERVRIHERTNALSIAGRLDPTPDAFVCDLSFRSLRGAATALLSTVREAWGIALVKPQFELDAELRWGRSVPERLDRGVVAEHDARRIVDRLLDELATEAGITVVRRMVSPLPGRRGNREELVLLATGAGAR